MLSKFCSGCGQVKDRGSFSKHTRSKGGLQTWCKSCAAIYRKQDIRKEIENRNRKVGRDKDKIEVLTHYGNGKLACVKCGFTDTRALSIDHINGGGTKHTVSIGRHMYRWLKSHKFPEGYQTLCMNCQWIKRVEKGEIRRIE